MGNEIDKSAPLLTRGLLPRTARAEARDGNKLGTESQGDALGYHISRRWHEDVQPNYLRYQHLATR